MEKYTQSQQARKRRRSIMIERGHGLAVPSNKRTRLATKSKENTRQVTNKVPSSEGQISNANSMIDIQYMDLGTPKHVCSKCKAVMWYGERVNKAHGTKNPSFSMCCLEGKVVLEPLKETSQYLKDLLNHKGGRKSTKFRDNIRAYNSMFAFTSMGAQVDQQINYTSGPYVFRMRGQNYHQIGALLPPPNSSHKFLQLYMYDDVTEEVNSRLQSLSNNRNGSDLDKDVVRGLLKMLDEVNCLAKAFRMARDRISSDKPSLFELRLLGERQATKRQYNAPTASEVAALIVGDLGQKNDGRDVIVDHKKQGLQRKSEKHPSYMALQYPLLFPYGEDGYHKNIPYSSNSNRREICRKHLTMREFYAYRLQQRVNQGTTLLFGGRLLQQYIVDCYTAVEEERLNWVRYNQDTLRTDILRNVYDAVNRGDTIGASVGKRTVLPSSFTRGPRYMAQNYQDAMAICRWYGNPSLFITFTANPKWKEIQYMLQQIDDQRPEDRPDIVCRVYSLKLQQMMKVLTKDNHFGKVRAVIYTIEFQKRGLPHAHILLWLEVEEKHNSPHFIDKIISAEIPDEETDGKCNKLVSQFMIHGPCGDQNKKAPCMMEHRCTKKFPKNYQPETTIDMSGYAIYKRRDNGRIVEKGGIALDNRSVVPYNRELLLMFEAHINVEWCNQAKAIKYLFKYLSKGPDRATLIIKNKNNEGKTTEHGNDDEIKNYLDCRYLSACEGIWRIFQFDIHYRVPAVVRLYVHLPGEQSITLRDDENLTARLGRDQVSDTMFTQWMKMNEINAEARQLTYAEFPTKFVWNEAIKVWDDKNGEWKKTKAWTPRKQGRCLGRIAYVHPTAKERYYLRLLLNSARGPTSYEDIRTVNGRTYPTYKEACYAIGVINDDKEWHDAMTEANHSATSSQLRELFVTILLFCEVSDPLQFWETCSTMLCDDILLKRRKMYKHPSLQLTEEQIKTYCLLEIEKILSQSGKSLMDFQDLPYPEVKEVAHLDNRLICDELSYDTVELKQQAEAGKAQLNEEQLKIFDAIVLAVESGEEGTFFVYGHGGTGKTFLYSTIAAKLRSEKKIVLTVASSGIASLLLPGGRTAYSRFDIPIELFEGATCKINRQTQLADLLIKSSLIVWDEAPMDHKYAFEAVERTMEMLLGM